MDTVSGSYFQCLWKNVLRHCFVRFVATSVDIYTFCNYSVFAVDTLVCVCSSFSFSIFLSVLGGGMLLSTSSRLIT